MIIRFFYSKILEYMGIWVEHKEISHSFEAYRDDSDSTLPSGWLMYTPEEDGSVTLEGVRTTTWRMGIGTALVKAFSDFIGPGRCVRGVIEHKPTLEILQELGLFDEARIKGTVNLTDPGLFSTLPFVKLQERGNIDTVSITIEPHSYEQDKQSVFYEGRTRIQA